MKTEIGKTAEFDIGQGPMRARATVVAANNQTVKVEMGHYNSASSSYYTRVVTRHRAKHNVKVLRDK